MSYLVTADITDVLLKEHLLAAHLTRSDNYIDALMLKKGAETIDITPLAYEVKELLICKVCAIISADRIGTSIQNINFGDSSFEKDIYKEKYDFYNNCVEELEKQITKEMLDGSKTNYTSYGFQTERS